MILLPQPDSYLVWPSLETPKSLRKMYTINFTDKAYFSNLNGIKIYSQSIDTDDVTSLLMFSELKPKLFNQSGLKL